MLRLLAAVLASALSLSADTSRRNAHPAGLKYGWVFPRKGTREEKTGGALQVTRGSLDREGLHLDRGYALLEEKDAGLIVGSLTIECWVRIDEFASGWVCLVCRGQPGSSSDQSYGLYAGHRGCLYFTNLRGTVQTQDGLLKAGIWTHVAGVVDAKTGELRVAVNGEPVAKHASAGPVQDRGGGPLCIGGDARQYQHGISATFHSVRVYDRALSEPELRSRSKSRP